MATMSFPASAALTGPTLRYSPKLGAALWAPPIRRTASAMPTPPRRTSWDIGELTIKALLGHARIGVTSGYIATVDSVLLASAENIARYIEAAMNGERGIVVQLAGQRRSSRLANVL